MSKENDNQDPTEIDLNDPKIKQAIESAVSEQVAGLKSNREEILSEKKKLKDELTELRNAWGDLDPEYVKKLVGQFEQSEEAKMIAEGKIEDVLNKRTEAMRRDADTRVNAAVEKLAEKDAMILMKDAKIAQLVIDSNIDEAAHLQECTPSALRDIRRAARDVFSLDEEHAPVARGPDGTFRMGKNGKDPLTPAEWLEQQREESPHWWGVVAGGGASGGTKLPDGSKLTEETINKMSPQQKMVYSINHGARSS